jgi:hypothetical protein
MHRRTALTLAVILASVTALSGCVTRREAGAAVTPRLAPTAQTLQEIMLEHIDPNADALWDAVAYVSSVSGTEDRRPRTPQEWQDVRQSALGLVEGGSLLRQRGRRVARNPTAPGPGELPLAQIETRIAATPEAFDQLALGLQVSARKALEAIDANDPQRLLDAGGEIDQACEACHRVYWYPDLSASGV